MELFYIVEGMFIIIAIGINYILGKKIQEKMKNLIEEKKKLIERNIELMQIELEIRNILDNAEKTNEFAIHTVQKIRKNLLTVTK